MAGAEWGLWREWEVRAQLEEALLAPVFPPRVSYNPIVFAFAVEFLLAIGASEANEHDAVVHVVSQL